MHQENRTYARISTRLRGFARKVSNPDLPPLFHQENLVQELREGISKEANLPEGMRSFLIQMNKKLDLLLSLQGREFIEKDFPIQTEIIELSAAGLRCLRPADKEAVQVGDLLEFVLLLSYLPMKLVGVVGLVHRLEHIERDAILAIKFTAVRESAREEIVQFVFSEQREQIRTLKR